MSQDAIIPPTLQPQLNRPKCVAWSPDTKLKLHRSNLGVVAEPQILNLARRQATKKKKGGDSATAPSRIKKVGSGFRVFELLKGPR